MRIPVPVLHGAVNRVFMLLVVAAVLAGCTKDERKDEAWCDAMMATPNNLWSEDDASLFARDCLYNDD